MAQQPRKKKITTKLTNQSHKTFIIFFGDLIKSILIKSHDFAIETILQISATFIFATAHNLMKYRETNLKTNQYGKLKQQFDSFHSIDRIDGKLNCLLLFAIHCYHLNRISFNRIKNRQKRVNNDRIHNNKPNYVNDIGLLD